MNIIPSSGSTFLHSHDKGQVAQLGASQYFIYRGWEVTRPENQSSPYDLLIRHPRTGECYMVQVKTLTNTNRSIPTYSTGSGNDKGSKRERTDYAKCGIHYLIGIDLNTLNAYLYPLDFYKGKRKFSVDKNPSFDIEFITDRGYKNYKKDMEISTLDLLANDES